MAEGHGWCRSQSNRRGYQDRGVWLADWNAVCRAMGDGIHEIRSRLPGNRQARVLFYIDSRRRLVLLHGFIKKARSTPAGDLALARANKRKHERGLT